MLKFITRLLGRFTLWTFMGVIFDKIGVIWLVDQLLMQAMDNVKVLAETLVECEPHQAEDVIADLEESIHPGLAPKFATVENGVVVYVHPDKIPWLHKELDRIYVAENPAPEGLIGPHIQA